MNDGTSNPKGLGRDRPFPSGSCGSCALIFVNQYHLPELSLAPKSFSVEISRPHPHGRFGQPLRSLHADWGSTRSDCSKQTWSFLEMFDLVVPHSH